MSGSNGCVGSGCSNAIKAGLQGAKTPTLDGIQSAQVKDTFHGYYGPFHFHHLVETVRLTCKETKRAGKKDSEQLKSKFAGMISDAFARMQSDT
jgi:hypothetical protein